MSPRHWDAVARMATDSGCRVVVPIYTLAPLSTAREWEQAALDLVIKLSKDERYEDYQFVHMGDSAGGWMTFRIYQAMCEIALGEDGEKKKAIDEVLGRSSTGIMISPLINPEINDELIEASQSVSNLHLASPPAPADIGTGLLALGQPVQLCKPPLDKWPNRFS